MVFEMIFQIEILEINPNCIHHLLMDCTSENGETCENEDSNDLVI